MPGLRGLLIERPFAEVPEHFGSILLISMIERVELLMFTERCTEGTDAG